MCSLCELHHWFFFVNCNVCAFAAASAVLQGAICGLACYFPAEYMQAIMTGLVSLLQVVGFHYQPIQGLPQISWLC